MKPLKVGRGQIIGGLQGKIFKRHDVIRITCAEESKGTNINKACTSSGLSTLGVVSQHDAVGRAQFPN